MEVILDYNKQWFEWFNFLMRIPTMQLPVSYHARVAWLLLRKAT